MTETVEVPAMDDNDMNFKNNYVKHLKAFEEQNKGSHRKIWTREKTQEVLTNLRNTKKARIAGAKLTSMEYYWSSKYDCVEVNGQEYVTFKKKNPDDPTVLIIPSEEFFDVLMPVHISCGHGGRDKMLKSIKNKFYIPKKAIEILSAFCPVCVHKKNNSSDVHKSKISESFNVKGVLDIVDFQSCPDGDYKWLLMYQDHTTKFFNFRPLKTKESKEIAMELLKIFLTFGPPSILHSLTGDESIDEILNEIRNIWPTCKTINATNNQGGYHEPDESQPNRSNSIATMLHSWMSENSLTNWSVGCYFYQYHINTSTSAYKALFCRGYKYTPNSTTVLSTMLPTDDVISENTNVHSELSLKPKTNTTILNTEHGVQSSIPESQKIVPVPNKFTMLSNEDSSFLNTQMELQDFQTEIKIEFDDSQMPLEEGYYTEGDSIIKHEKIEEEYAHPNPGYDDPTEYFESNLDMKLSKTEPIEEDHHLQIKCSVCQDDAFIENTILCSNCNSNIHNMCAICYVKDEESDSKILCNVCLMKVFPNLYQKLAHKGMKRAAGDIVGNTLKKFSPSANNSYGPGPSSG